MYLTANEILWKGSCGCNESLNLVEQQFDIDLLRQKKNLMRPKGGRCNTDRNVTFTAAAWLCRLVFGTPGFLRSAQRPDIQNENFSCLSSVPTGKWRFSNPNCGMTESFHLPPTTFFINDPTILRYII